MSLRRGASVLTMVKKMTADGAACRKCLLVEKQMARDGLRGHIDRVVYTGTAEGDRLVDRHAVQVAPFFVSRADDGAETVYTSYLRMRRDIGGSGSSDAEAVEEIAVEVL